MPEFALPLLSEIPVIGEAFFPSGPISILTLVLVPVIHFALFRTRWGLRTRAIGEYPSAADTAGIDVIGMRFVNVTIAGVLAGLAGAYLSLEATSSFQRA